ncbi:unnamed protein product [Durusdinium trenchii]|uniref:Uncharacterized protein n=2 Tax=Durusdinium trenchii TaxID=1381693 RepID=A0ABP0QRS0_9DINO
MDIGKRMMEKWGWAKGQGLGKDNKGMTSCLVLRKDSGSSTQGRIESVGEEPTLAHEAASLAAKSLLSSLGAELGVGMPDPVDLPADAPKKRKSRWDDGDAVPTPEVPPLPVEVPTLGHLQMVPAGPSVRMSGDGYLGAPPAPAASTASSNPNFGLNQGGQKPRMPYMWPKHVDDWRWSKGFEATYCFEEVGLPSGMLEVARRILGDGSRFPTRVADATDCNVEVTAWGSLLVRPKGTGGDIDKAKRMLFEVLHPAAEALRSEAFEVEEMSPDQDAKEADQVGPRGLVAEEKEKEHLANQKKRRVGLGLVEGETSTVDKAAPLESVAIPLATLEDMQTIQRHINDLRVATGVAPVLQDFALILYGGEKKLHRAQQLVQTLLETGEWVAFSEAFVLSEETKQKRRGDGPSTQLLIKLPECAGIKVLEKHLTSMELAAEADQLKLTSKPVAGKRTLMVEGPPKAHERVKLMVKELMEKGQSPMLTKFLNGSKAGTGRLPQSVGANPAKAPVSVSSTIAPGVIAAPPVIETKKEVKEEIKVKEEVKEEPLSDEEGPKKELPKLNAGWRLMAPPTRMKATKAKAKPPKAEAQAADDLFADLPEPGKAKVPEATATSIPDGITE